MAFGRTNGSINILYLLTYLLVLYHHWWCFGGLWKVAWVSASPLRNFCNAVVWIAELVHGKKVGS